MSDIWSNDGAWNSRSDGPPMRSDSYGARRDRFDAYDQVNKRQRNSWSEETRYTSKYDEGQSYGNGNMR